jgi:hypothetical protein
MKNINRVIILALLILIAILFFRSCEANREKDDLLEQVASYKLGEKSFKKKILDDSSTLATQTQTILTQKEAIRLGLLKLDAQIKIAQSQVRQKQEVKIERVEVAYIPNGYADTTEWLKRLHSGDTSKSICDSLIANSIIVPQTFKKEDKWYSIDGKVQKNGLLLDSIRIHNESSVTIGWQKYGFLNLRRKPLVEVKNTNPYIDVPKMDNVVIPPKNGVLNKKGTWLGIGVIIGIILKNL